MTTQNTQTLAQVNALALSAIRSAARPMLQPMAAPVTLDGSQLGRVPVYARVSPRMSGILRHIFVRVEADITVPAGTTLAHGSFGPANLVSNFQFTDLNNNKRIDTTGFHLAMLQAVRQKKAPGAAYLTDTPLEIGSEIGSGISMPSVASGSTSDQVVTVAMTYRVPVAYSNSDLRGAMYLSTTQANAYLQMTINPLLFVENSGSADADSIYFYSGTKAPACGQIRVVTYQDYLDQIPTDTNGNVLLPVTDMAQLYQLINSTQTGISANSDFRIDFGNLRTYMSQFARYKNNNGYAAGTDINTFKIEAANMYQFLNTDPTMHAFRTVNALGFNPPAGTYYFDLRNHPINTTMYGNLALTINAKTAGTSNTSIETLSEFFSDTLTQGASTLASR